MFRNKTYLGVPDYVIVTSRIILACAHNDSDSELSRWLSEFHDIALNYHRSLEPGSRPYGDGYYTALRLPPPPPDRVTIALKIINHRLSRVRTTAVRRATVVGENYYRGQATVTVASYRPVTGPGVKSMLRTVREFKGIVSQQTR